MVRRIENQIERVFRKTYGARDGLRTLVRLGAGQLSDAGATAETARAEMVLCVTRQLVSGGPDAGPQADREADAERLTPLMLEWVAEAYAPNAKGRRGT
jgi:hypothetical protein